LYGSSLTSGMRRRWSRRHSRESVTQTDKYVGTDSGAMRPSVQSGIDVLLKDRIEKFRPVLTGLKVIKAIMDLFPGKIEFREGWKAEDFSFDLLAGTATIREELLAGVEPEDIEIG